MLHPAVFRDLTELEQKIKGISDRNAIGICPGPALADKYREYLERIGCESVDVVTIFKFAQNFLTTDSNFNSAQFFNKSSLLLSLSTLWKTHLPELSLADFQLAHKVFTDLRGHFLVPDFLETILVDFRPEIKKCILYFWHFLQNAKILDEHGVYGELAHQLRTPAHPAFEYLPTQTYLFFGFRHFTGVQVDFLKSLAIKHDVYIFIPEPAYASSRATDWITWLFPNKETEAPSRQDIHKPMIRCQVIRPTYNRHSELLIKQLDCATPTNIILAKKELNSTDLSTIYQNNYFKLESQIFTGILESVKKNILAQIETCADRSFTVADLKNYIDHDCKKKLAEKNFRNQRTIKVMLLLRANLKIWEELSAQNTEVDGDIWKLICESTQLDLPRNYLIPVAFSRHSSSIMSIEGLELDHSLGRSVLVVSEQYGEIISDNNAFADSILGNIAALSPVRSAELEKNILKFWLDVFLAKEQNILFYEQGIEERSFFWKMMLGVMGPQQDSVSLLHKKNEIDVLARYINQKYQHKSLTSSRLQTYCECPRKFYFQELQSFRLDKRSKVQLENFELGDIEHLVIKDFFENNIEFNYAAVNDLVSMRLKEYLRQRALQIKNFSLATAQKEILEYSMNGISALKSLMKQYDFTSVKFEFPFDDSIKDVHFKGRIDCILENNQGYAILDFKRGTGSIPSMKAFDRFEKLQIWFYLSHCHIAKKILCFGLICLSGINESMLKSLAESEEKTVLIPECDDMGLKMITHADYEKQLKEYQLYEEEIVSDLYVDELFKASPMKAQVCDFCDLAALCSKGQL
ncbi:MAG: PD-(D/E)XK nuclease family protein [Bdellovibrio sp.]|nr:PD-(D/E)XK nuclease family protein [Bdellovibrio sp.]